MIRVLLELLTFSFGLANREVDQFSELYELKS